MMTQTRLQPDRDSINKKCSCDAWTENKKKVDNLFISAWIHGLEYDGSKFEWCPWCGKPLEEDTDGKPK